MTLKITVDADLCQGHGVCESEAPGVFRVGKDRQVELIDPAPADDQRTAVTASVKYCPTHALSLDD